MGCVFGTTPPGFTHKIVQLEIRTEWGWKRPFSHRRDHPSIDIPHAAHPAERHGDVELLAEHLDRLGDAGLAAGAEAIDIGAADHAGARAERERAHHVLPGADAAVEHHLDLLADRV